MPTVFRLLPTDRPSASVRLLLRLMEKILPSPQLAPLPVSNHLRVRVSAQEQSQTFKPPLEQTLPTLTNKKHD
ncbi:hypothetical protein FEM03_02430 [Phragmitibacter flavus]|uniref:Uncharacterized protein n=1 Tax=Phragmitibacter flavus TaxID=2576071 RepID=A0A5R8KIU6_9BACT|nr:hypothetical protein [Phragmitibacter flavus]TLD72233.1 hypothetical protein FEM03_02430 [Phragmitibacter flavus]